MSPFALPPDVHLKLWPELISTLLHCLELRTEVCTWNNERRYMQRDRVCVCLVCACVYVCTPWKFAAMSSQVVLVFVSLFVALCLASAHTIQVFVCVSSSLQVCVSVSVCITHKYLINVQQQLLFAHCSSPPLSPSKKCRHLIWLLLLLLLSVLLVV